jgi:hypothetical protein
MVETVSDRVVKGNPVEVLAAVSLESTSVMLEKETACWVDERAMEAVEKMLVVLVALVLVSVAVSRILVEKVVVEDVVVLLEVRCVVVERTLLDGEKGGGIVPLRYSTLGKPSVLLQKQPCRKVRVPSCRSATI